MENKIVDTRKLALLYNGQNVVLLGTVIALPSGQEWLFESLEKFSCSYFDSSAYNAELKKDGKTIIMLDALYSKENPEYNKSLRNNLDSNEDTVLFCVWAKKKMPLSDLKKVEIYLKKSIKGRFMVDESLDMFEDKILPLLENSSERE